MDPMFTSKIYFHDGGNGMYAADHCQISPIFPFGKFYWVTKHYAGIMNEKVKIYSCKPQFSLHKVGFTGVLTLYTC